MTRTWIQIQNEPIKAMNRLDLQLSASKRIRDDSGLTILSITGKQQGGKSSYGMLILWELYNGDVDEIMKHIVFTIEDFTKLISNAINGGYRERCILWDDCSIQGGASKWMIDPKGVMYLSGLGDSLGVATKSVIMTSPSGDMVRAFRNYTKYKVVISQGKHKWDRVARGYWIGKSPMEQRYCSLEFEDCYDTRISFYERYALVRKEISLMAIKNLNNCVFNKETEQENKPLTTKDKIFEIRRDIEAGIYEGMSQRDVFRANKINPDYANNVISKYYR